MNNDNDDQMITEKPYVFRVRMSSDYYSAYLTIEMNDESYKFNQDAIIAELNEKNVTFGIKYDQIQKIIDDPGVANDFLIAEGIRHVNGNDGVITRCVGETSHSKPALLENGKVDFKNLNFANQITKGQVLATRTMPTEGENGTTVTGKIIKGKNGKIVNFKFGKNVDTAEDGLSIYSTVDGTLQTNGDKVQVIEVLQINGDVGVKTGNIKFSGKVVINGNITTGFEIECDDDLTVNGIVEGAILKTKSNLFISVGIQGHDLAKIDCKGDMISGFINNASIRVAGNIESASILHSDIICNSKLAAMSKKGSIVGGNIQVREEVSAKVIGSEMGTITNLRLGMDSTLMDEYQTLNDTIKDVKDNMKKLDQALNLLTKKMKADPNNGEVKEIVDKTKMSKMQYQMELRDSSARFKEIVEEIGKLQGSSVTANIMYPGTKIRIGNSFYNVKDSLAKISVKKQGGDIIAVPAD